MPNSLPRGDFMRQDVLNFNQFDEEFKEELLLFVGRNADIYEKRWTKMGQRRNKMVSWHWPAFFVSPFWSGYRQCWPGVWIYLGLYIVDGLLDVWLPVKFAYYDQTMFVVSVIYGLFSNYNYLNFAVQHIETMRQVEPDREKRKFELTEQGGPSVPKFWLAFAMMTVVGIAMMNLGRLF